MLPSFLVPSAAGPHFNSATPRLHPAPGSMELAGKAQAGLGAALGPALRTAAALPLAPLRLLAAWVAFWAGLAMEALAWLGAAPAGFVPQVRLGVVGRS